MNSLVITALSYALVSTWGAGQPSATTLRSCATGDATACAVVETGLETVFAGRNEADRELGRKLASAAVQVLRTAAISAAEPKSTERQVITVAVRQCSANESDACSRILGVLLGLFTGCDAQLDHSTDRPLARAIGRRLSSIVANGARQ